MNRKADAIREVSTVSYSRSCCQAMRRDYCRSYSNFGSCGSEKLQQFGGGPS